MYILLQTTSRIYFPHAIHFVYLSMIKPWIKHKNNINYYHNKTRKVVWIRKNERMFTETKH